MRNKMVNLFWHFSVLQLPIYLTCTMFKCNQPLVKVFLVKGLKVPELKAQKEYLVPRIKV